MKRKSTTPRGVILYRGPSRIDGKPIVAIATLKSKNRKTGDMIQTWIIRDRISPIAAASNGGDYSVCGDCALRGWIERLPATARHRFTNRGRGCYVSLKNAPTQVYKALRRGIYPRYDAQQHASLFRGRMLRLGSYGDPVAIPLSVWRPIMNLGDGHTGYTHSWRIGRFHHWKRYIMASTHSAAENAAAIAMGWRTFRTIQPGGELTELEVICPASTEGGLARTCATCAGCNGNRNGSTERRSFAIVGHGSPAVLAGVNRVSS